MNKLQASVSNGLSTDLFRADVAGLYHLYADSTVTLGSGLVITLSQSGSSSVSVSTPPTSPLEEIVNINHLFNCAVGDLLSVVVSSSAAADQPPALVKTTIRLSAGV